MLLVDYRCQSCNGTTEHRVNSPIPDWMTCPTCRSQARRIYSPIGLGARIPASTSPKTANSDEALCQKNPWVPGLCHMTPDAGRAWVARARGDTRTLDRELERQERARQDNPGHVPDPISHDHSKRDHSTHAHGEAGHSTHTHDAIAGARPSIEGRP
jgi:hypothetical protein